MDQLLEAIRTATATDASDEARAAGAQACRTILTALEATPGELLAPTPIETTPVQAVVAALRGVPPDQLLDLAIARLRAALPAGTDVKPVAPLKFHILPLAPTGGRS
ncbi:MAG: hypothetical protein WKG01_31205 [Kofleriaceae bacterium]